VISSRSMWLLGGANLLPVTLAIDLILHRLHGTRYPEWIFIETFNSYAFVFVLLTLYGLVAALFSIFSIGRDYCSYRKAHARTQ
jgi:hypothetical protein